jgi:hypothetical protein
MDIINRTTVTAVGSIIRQVTAIMKILCHFGGMITVGLFSMNVTV